MYNLWVTNYSAEKPVTVKMIIIYDSDYMKHVPSTSEHRFVTNLFLIYRGLKLMLNAACVLISLTQSNNKFV